MNVFKKKQLIKGKRVCLRLKSLRQSKGVSLEQLAQKTKLDKKLLSAMEECRFNELPSAAVYQKNFIKYYLKSLGVKPDSFIKQFMEEEKIDPRIEHPKKSIRQNPLSRLPNILKFAAISFVVVVLVGYLGLQVKHIVQPPVLNVITPQDGYITDKSSVLLHGKTDKEVAVMVNGQQISNIENGEFEELVDLTPGVNTLTISAEKKHGKSTTIIRHVIYKENQLIGLAH